MQTNDATQWSHEVIRWMRENAGKKADKVLQVAAYHLFTEIDSTVPVDTGALQDNIMVTAGGDWGGALQGRFAWMETIGKLKMGDDLVIAYDIYYAVYVHFGAGGRTARPWLYNAGDGFSQFVRMAVQEVGWGK